jgi:hypothetical protein
MVARIVITHTLTPIGETDILKYREAVSEIARRISIDHSSMSVSCDNGVVIEMRYIGLHVDNLYEEGTPVIGVIE